mgnify:CR=1 FL=1
MRKPETIESLYLDFDGFFASVMQQAMPALRGRPRGGEGSRGGNGSKDRPASEDAAPRRAMGLDLTRAKPSSSWSPWCRCRCRCRRSCRSLHAARRALRERAWRFGGMQGVEVEPVTSDPLTCR